MIRVFPRKTKWTPEDELVFIGLPPLFRPPEQPVKISVAFTWDIETGKMLKNEWAHITKMYKLAAQRLAIPGGRLNLEYS